VLRRRKRAETSDYRRKKLTDRNDDYANMRELVRWRAERAVAGEDDRPDPDLLLIGGGGGSSGPLATRSRRPAGTFPLSRSRRPRNWS